MAVLASIFFMYLALHFNEVMWRSFDASIRALVKDNTFISTFHYIGEPVVAVIAGITLVLFFAIRGRDYRAVLFVVLVFAGGNGLNQLLKFTVQRPRPQLVDQLTTYSFPSGHTMAGFFTVITIAYFLTRTMSEMNKQVMIWLIAVSLAILVGLARVAEGRHFATDVVAGWCISYAWFTVCLWWYEQREQHFKNN